MTMQYRKGIYRLRHNEEGWLSRFGVNGETMWGSLPLDLPLNECLAIAITLKLAPSEYFVVPAVDEILELAQQKPIEPEANYGLKLIEFLEKNLVLFFPNSPNPPIFLNVGGKTFGGCYAEGRGFHLSGTNNIYPSIAQAFLSQADILALIESEICATK